MSLPLAWYIMRAMEWNRKNKMTHSSDCINSVGPLILFVPFLVLG